MSGEFSPILWHLSQGFAVQSKCLKYMTLLLVLKHLFDFLRAKCIALSRVFVGSYYKNKAVTAFFIIWSKSPQLGLPSSSWVTYYDMSNIMNFD